MGPPRVRFRTMMAAVAFLAMALAIIVQSVRLHQALIREQQLRAEAGLQRAQVEKVEYARRIAEAQAQWRQLGSLAAPKP